MNALTSELRILLVEDDACCRELLGDLLEDEGYLVTRTQSVSEARAQLELFEFDLAMLDYRLPDGTADEVLAGLADRTEVLLVSGASNVLSSSRATLVAKPFDVPSLLEAVARHALAGRRKCLMRWRGLSARTCTQGARPRSREELEQRRRERRGHPRS